MNTTFSTVILLIVLFPPFSHLALTIQYLQGLDGRLLMKGDGPRTKRDRELKAL